MSAESKFWRTGLAIAVGLMVCALSLPALAQIPGGTLSPSDVPKYVQPLVKPPAMPGKINKNKDKYDIAVRQFGQQILPPTLPMTTVWSYGLSKDVVGDNEGKTIAQGGTYFYPALTIEATANKDTQVIWRNELKDALGNFRPHLLPIDQTLHWANPPGGMTGRDMRPMPGDPWFSTGFYTGPVPIITHLHGAHTTEDSDGFPEAWYLPDAVNIPAGYASTGAFFDYFNTKYAHGWEPGAASFKYPNSQRATTLWYHDHTLGMTRANVYAGPAGFWLIRGGPDDLNLGYTAPGVGANPLGSFTEIPMLIQDRSFNTDGSLYFPDNRAFFDGFTGPFIPETPISPAWNPEFFGNMMVVNGQTWPYLEVNKQRYRFRLLNGCDSRFLYLDFSAITGVKVWWIGTDGGFLPAPVDITTNHSNRLLLALAERADIIVDFSGVAPGNYVLKNLGPDEPFGGGEPGVDFDPSDENSTGQVMQFRVKNATPATDPGADPATLTLPAITPVAPASKTRYVSLNEEMYMHENFPDGGEGPAAAKLGTYDPATGLAVPFMWMDAITENPGAGIVEEWKIVNTTGDAHPIHIHLVQFQVVGRESMEAGGLSITGSNEPLAWEAGFKDTVIAYPGEITTVKAQFDIPGLYVWHCHILSHEDNEMMRPYHVGPVDPNLPRFLPGNTVAEWNAIAQEILQPGTGMSMPMEGASMEGVSMSAAFVYLAYMQGAVYDALAAIDGGYKPYAYTATPDPTASRQAAVATAAYTALKNYFPNNSALDVKYAASLATILINNPADQTAKDSGMAIGEAAADAMIALRAGDILSGDGGYVLLEPGPGIWERAMMPDGVTPMPPMDPWMAILKPFLRATSNLYRSAPPPALDDPAYLADLSEVRDWGGAVSSFRTPEQTAIANFWGTNMVVQTNAAYRQIADNRKLNLLDTARLMAMGNMVATDSLIATFDTKYTYSFWRPVTAIQHTNPVDNSYSDTPLNNWMPAMMTPNFPEYVAGHGSFMSSQAEVFTWFFGTDQINIDLSGTGGAIRHYNTAAELRAEIINARTWGGMHFRSSTELAVALGQQLAADAVATYFVPM